MKIIGIAGRDGVGKTATAWHLYHNLADLIPADRLAEVMEMSDPIEEVLGLMGLVRETEEKTDAWRELCVAVAKFGHDRNPNWILKNLIATAAAERDPADVLIVSGVRRASEAGYIRALGGEVVCVCDDADGVPAGLGGEDAVHCLPAPHCPDHADAVAEYARMVSATLPREARA